MAADQCDHRLDGGPRLLGPCSTAVIRAEVP